jgi:hypothetical protein
MGHKSETFPGSPLRAGACKNFLASPSFTRLPKNPLFEVISLHGPTGPLGSKNFLATLAHFQIETFTLAPLKARGPLGPHHF